MLGKCDKFYQNIIIYCFDHLLVIALILPLAILWGGILINYPFSWQFSYKNLSIFLIISPIIEEYTFRKIFQDYIQAKLKRVWLNITIVNIVFALAHVYKNHQILYLMMVFSAGTIFSLLKIRYNRIMHCMIIHAYYNFCYILFCLVGGNYAS